MRILALDVGKKKIGIAVTDPLAVTARPYSTVERSRAGMEKIVQSVKELESREVVIGLPLHLDGTEGEQASDVRKFAGTLAPHIDPVQIKFWDERLTTVEAQERLSNQRLDWKKTKKRIDAYAAAILLEAYLLEK